MYINHIAQILTLNVKSFDFNTSVYQMYLILRLVINMTQLLQTLRRTMNKITYSL